MLPQLQLQPMIPWWQIPDFTSEIGDIKLVWEPSRLDEVVYLAQLYACQKDQASLAKLNMLILGWANNNVPYRGANWKCARKPLFVYLIWRQRPLY